MLQSGQKNGLLFATWLVEHGYSRQLLSRYRSSGWLSSLCKGVMFRTGDTLSAFGALQSFNVTSRKEFSCCSAFCFGALGLQPLCSYGQTPVNGINGK